MASMMLLWLMMNTVMGTSIMITMTAAPTPARATPPDTIWFRA